MVARKIIVLKGSPRQKGNSCTLANSLVKGAKDNGAHVEEFFLHKLDIKPCNACNGCFNNPEKDCVIDDDMQKIYPSLRTADAIVIATPTYWFNMSAQTKLVIDRLYGLIEPTGHVLKNKKIGIILTYGDSNETSSGAINAINSFKDTFRYIGAEIIGIVHGSAMDIGQIQNNDKLMEEANNLGKQLSMV